MQTKKVYKLDDDEPQLPFRLIGVGTSLKYYTLCHQLNQLWDIDFAVIDPLKISVVKGQKVEFTSLLAQTESGDLTYYLFVNKEGGNYLLPEAANYDFIIKIEGAGISNETIKKSLLDIRSVNGILLSAEIPISKIKQIQRLRVVNE